MARLRRMVELGRRGGNVGGRARARSLAPARRRAIARAAARARWSRPLVAPSARLDLASLVAHVGSAAAPGVMPPHLERHVLSAVEASRGDSALARMLPVFLWRTRDRLDQAELLRLARRRRQQPALGFFLDLAAQLGPTRAFDASIEALAASAPRRPSYFFRGTARRPFECRAADLGTPEQARRWGLLMNMPFDSFASHFEKTARL